MNLSEYSSHAPALLVSEQHDREHAGVLFSAWSMLEQRYEAVGQVFVIDDHMLVKIWNDYGLTIYDPWANMTQAIMRGFA